MDTGKKIAHSKFIIIAFVVVMALSSLLYFFYENVYLIEETELPSSMQEKILESAEVDLDSLVEGAWDSLVIIRPYTQAKEVKENFGININRLKNGSIQYGEGQTLFVFCKGNYIESYFYMKYPIQVDYESFSYEKKIPRSDAKFQIINDGEMQNLVNIKE